VHEADVGVLFRHRRDLTVWALWLERGRAEVSAWRRGPDPTVEAPAVPPQTTQLPLSSQQPAREPLLPLVLLRNGAPVPVDDRSEYREGDRVWFALDGTRREAATQILESRGWTLDATPVEAP